MRTRTGNNTSELHDHAFVFSGAAIGLLLFELFFKWRIIFSQSFVLDDAFMVERAIHDKSFDDLANFLPAFEGSNLDNSPGLKVFRFLANMSGDIVTLRLIFAILFAIACAIFAVLIFRITKDRIFSILAAIFACITPFSPILVIFTNASYNIIYFLVFFTALLVGSFIHFERSAQLGIRLTLIITILFFITNLLVPSSFAFPLAAITWLFFHTEAYKSRFGRILFSCLGLIFLIQAAGILLTHTSPYQAMPGRVSYDLDIMFLNGLSIIQTSISSYLDPMVGTGKPTRQTHLFVSMTFICAILLLYLGAMFRVFRKADNLSILGPAVVFTFFLGFCIVFSVGPYATLVLSHLWHFFPHMIFLCSVSYILVYFSVSKRVAYLLLATTGLLTVRVYIIQIPEYEEAVHQQKLFSNFVRLEHASWRPEDRVFLIHEAHVLGGLNHTFRSTGFARYVSRNPDAPIFAIVNSDKAEIKGAEEPDNQGTSHTYVMDKSGSFKRVP